MRMGEAMEEYIQTDFDGDLLNHGTRDLITL